MSFQNDPDLIRWKLHLKSPPQRVLQLLSTDKGRASFWAESAVQHDGVIHFVFPNQVEWTGRVLKNEPPHMFQVEYYGGSITTFDLYPDGSGGTDLAMTNQGNPEEDRAEVLADWVSVLTALKASMDFGVDLRKHDPRRTWDQEYVDN
jgi:uncharacterized protein YndB with AHSA1/START domain